MKNGTDVLALRRIALLVTRATEDCDPIRDELMRIATVIDQMKRSILLDEPLEQNIAKLSSLIRHLPMDCKLGNTSCERLRNSLMGELQELVPTLGSTPQRRRSAPPAA